MKKLYLFIVLCIHLWNCTVHTGYVTNPCQSDGFGSQFQGIIAAAIYAELDRKQFVYTPFQTMEHNYDNDPAFLAKKEAFINFLGNFELNKGDVPQNVSYKQILDNYPEHSAHSATLAKIKRIFRANKDTNHFKNDRFNVAIHLRRPNQHDNRLAGADTPDQLFLDIISALRTVYHYKNPLFHIYSQGDVTKFAAFHADDIILHLDEPLEDTFLGLVFADSLVTSASSFSYAAALLSDGKIYYIPFWHTPFPGWISIHELVSSVKTAGI